MVYKEKVKVKCHTCEKELLRHPYRLKQKHQFCDQKCYGSYLKLEGYLKSGHTVNIGREPWNKGKIGVLSEESLQKMRDNYTYHVSKSCFKKGQDSWNKGLTKEIDERINSYAKKLIGRTHSQETKDKLSISTKALWDNYSKEERKNHIKKMQENMRRGEDSPNWISDRSFLIYPDEFNNELKEQIRVRDNHTCQQCKYTEEQLGYKLPIHHIDYNKKNSSPENLISLCRSCHAQTNFKRDDWTNYFKERVNA